MLTDSPKTHSTEPTQEEVVINPPTRFEEPEGETAPIQVDAAPSVDSAPEADELSITINKPAREAEAPLENTRTLGLPDHSQTLATWQHNLQELLQRSATELTADTSLPRLASPDGAPSTITSRLADALQQDSQRNAPDNQAYLVAAELVQAALVSLRTPSAKKGLLASLRSENPEAEVSAAFQAAHQALNRSLAYVQQAPPAPIAPPASTRTVDPLSRKKAPEISPSPYNAERSQAEHDDIIALLDEIRPILTQLATTQAIISESPLPMELDTAVQAATGELITPPTPEIVETETEVTTEVEPLVLEPAETTTEQPEDSSPLSPDTELEASAEVPPRRIIFYGSPDDKGPAESVVPMSEPQESVASELNPEPTADTDQAPLHSSETGDAVAGVSTEPLLESNPVDSSQQSSLAAAPARTGFFKRAYDWFNEPVRSPKSPSSKDRV